MIHINKLKQLMEARSKSLDRLGGEIALDVISEFPVETIRLFFRKLKQEGTEAANDDVLKIIKRIKDSIEDSIDPSNPLFSNNGYGISFKTLKKELINVYFKFKGNKLLWGFQAGPVYVGEEETKPIRLTNQSLNAVFDTIIEKIIESNKLGARYGIDRETHEKGQEYSKSLLKKDPTIIAKLNIIAKKFHFNISYEKRYEKSPYNKFTASNYFIDGSTNYKIEKYFDNNFNRSLTYSFQYKEMLELMKLVSQRLKANNYFITRINILSSSDGIYFVTELSDSKKKSKYLEDTHNKLIKVFSDNAKNKKFNSEEDITREEAYRIIMKRIFLK